MEQHSTFSSPGCPSVLIVFATLGASFGIRPFHITRLKDTAHSKANHQRVQTFHLGMKGLKQDVKSNRLSIGFKKSGSLSLLDAKRGLSMPAHPESEGLLSCVRWQSHLSCRPPGPFISGFFAAAIVPRMCIFYEPEYEPPIWRIQGI